MIKEYTCPNCKTKNYINKKSWDENLIEDIPVNLGKALLITFAAVLTGGIGGVVVGAALYGKSVISYFDGTSITCINPKCGKKFTIEE